MYRVKLLRIRSFLNKSYRAIRIYYYTRSLKAWQLLIRHLFLRMVKRNVPDLITIGLTNRCQCKCVHCAANAGNQKVKNELEAGKVKAIILEAKQLGVVRVTFFGGEPLLRGDIFDLVKFAHDAGMITRINTNGWLLNQEVIARLKDAGLSLCDVSIDDPVPEIHDQLRGLQGIFQKAVEGIRLLKEEGILCQIITYAAKRNICQGLEEIIGLGRKLGVFAVSIVFPMATGCWYDSFEVLLSEEEMEEVRKLGDSQFVHVELPTQHSRCSVSKKSTLYISPEGDVTPCPFIPYAIGNVKEKKFEEIWLKYLEGTKFNFSGDCPMNSLKNREGLKDEIELMNKQIKALQAQPVLAETESKEAQRGDERKPRELSF